LFLTIVIRLNNVPSKSEKDSLKEMFQFELAKKNKLDNKEIHISDIKFILEKEIHYNSHIVKFQAKVTINGQTQDYYGYSDYAIGNRGEIHYFEGTIDEETWNRCWIVC
jgi:hypothetical protein